MYLIDSSFWVALFLDFDSNHTKAENIMADLSGIIYVPYNVIAETTTVLSYKHSKQQADNFINFITNNRDIIIIDNNALPEIEFFKIIDAKLSFTDVSLIFLSQKMKLNLITFDKQIISFLHKKSTNAH